MSTNDWLRNRIEVTHKVRSVLVRHYIDLGYVDIGVSPRGVTLRGVLKATKGANIKLTAEVVNDIFRSIKSLKKVKRVYGEFANWRQTGGRGSWMPVEIESSEEEAAKPLLIGKTGAPGAESKVYTVVTKAKKPDSAKESGTEIGRI